VDLPCLRHGSLAGASLRTTVPLLTQEVFELVHQLLRVKIVLTPWARCLLTCRVIVLLQLPDIGLDGGVLRDSLVTLGPKGPHGRLKGATSSSRSSRWATVVSSAQRTAGLVVFPR
jgi:hypothetical protein